MAGEHHRDEDAGDLVGAEPFLAVLVLDGDEDVEHVAVLLALRRVRDASVHDLLHECHESVAGLVASPETLDRRVGIDEGQCVGALLEVVVEVGESSVELVAELLADQAGRRRVDGHFGEEFEQVDIAFVAPAGDHVLHLAVDGRRVAPHLFATQRRIVQHLLAAFGAGVEDDALTEDRLHERIGGLLVEILVRGTEEELVGLRTGE